MKKAAFVKALFAVLCLVCLFVPTVVHVFSPRVCSEITADGIMSYIIQTISAIGTISLAGVTIWQNRKMQTENDKAQDRMENLVLQANNTNSVAKIIEYEQNNLTNLKIALDEFSDACNLQSFVEQFSNAGNNSSELNLAINRVTLRADNSFFALARELRIKPDLIKKDENSFNKSVAKYYHQLKYFLEKYQNATISELKVLLEYFEAIRLEFYTEKENFLVDQETKLNKLLYGNLSIDEIKDMYRYYEKREENTNGKNENGITGYSGK